MHWGDPTNTVQFTQAEVNAVAGNFRSAWVSNFLPQQNAVVTLTNVDAIDLTDIIGAVGTATGSNNGAIAGTAMPANIAACVSWKEARHYRGGHARTYVVGPGSTATPLNTRTWGAAFVTAMASAASAYRLAVAASAAGRAGSMVVVHRTIGGETVPSPLPGVIIGQSFDSRIDSQRRRLGPDVAA